MEKKKGRERERKKERVKKGNVVGYTRLAWKTLPTLRPAGLKERKRGKKRKKERKKGTPAGGATFADLRLHRHLLQESFSRSDIDLSGSLWLATIHFLLICDREFSRNSTPFRAVLSSWATRISDILMLFKLCRAEWRLARERSFFEGLIWLFWIRL